MPPTPPMDALAHTFLQPRRHFFLLPLLLALGCQPTGPGFLTPTATPSAAATTPPAPTDAPEGTPTASPTAPSDTPTEASTPRPTPRPTPTATPACLDRDNDGYCGSADCNDASAASNPGAIEICDSLDNDCDLQIDEVDRDLDGWNDCLYDCAPQNPTSNPGAAESCNRIDDDCDEKVDEGFDKDGDGYPTCGSGTLDCDDTTSTINPGVGETCNTKDDDCDGVVDDGVGTTYYADDDNDTYGDATSSIQACTKPAGYVAQSGDCDDNSATTKPGATELCDGKDNNCNGSVLDETPLKTWYRDADGDGYGDPTSTTQACAAPAGYVSQSGDCGDSSSATKPGAPERCDGEDNDCDTQVDEGLGSTFYSDADGDGFGDPGSPAATCAACPGTCVTTAGDCDDGSASVYPGAPELPDGKDNDCDGEAEAAISLADVTATLTGTTAGGRLGAMITGPGDLDADGFDDIAVSAPQGSPSRAGATYVFYGHGGAWGSGVDNDAAAVMTVDQAGSGFGTALTGGDIDHDGYADLMIGAPQYNAFTWEDSGIVFVIWGGGTRALSESLTTTNPRAVYIAGYTPDVNLGASLDARGDMNGDGLDDLLIGAPWPWLTQVPPIAGITFILPGRVGRLLQAGGIGSNQLVQVYGEANQVIGMTVKHLGDLDGDGYGDFMAVGKGKQGSIGSTYADGGILYAVGGDAPTIFAPGALPPLQVSNFDLGSWIGDTAGDLVGKWLASPGDIDGDGWPDVVVGRQAAKSGEAMAMILMGGGLPASGNIEASADVLIKSSAGTSPCPCSVGEIGDYDGDGVGDFAVAGLGANGGKIYLFYGRETAWPRTLVVEEDADLVFAAAAAGDEAGASIAALGDIDGDGNDDFAIGAPGVNGAAGADTGRVYLFFGF